MSWQPLDDLMISLYLGVSGSDCADPLVEARRLAQDMDSESVTVALTQVMLMVLQDAQNEITDI